MKIYTLIAVLFVMFAASSANAQASWTTQKGGTDVCKEVLPGGICFIATAGATTKTIIMRQCASYKIHPDGAGLNVMVQDCMTRDATGCGDLLATALTGTSPDAFLADVKPLRFVRLVTTDSVTVSVTCGR